MPDFKESVRVATTANINLASMPATVDGVTLAANDRILVKNQTIGTQNGVYSHRGTAKQAKRTPDSQRGQWSPGAEIGVEEGTVNSDSKWVLSNDKANMDASDDLVFALMAYDSSTVEGDLSAHIADAAAAHAASAISILDTSTSYAGTTVELALAEIAAAYNALVTKLDADGGLTDTNYETLLM